LDSIADDGDENAREEDVGDRERGKPFLGMDEGDEDTGKDLEVQTKPDAETKDVRVRGNETLSVGSRHAN